MNFFLRRLAGLAVLALALAGCGPRVAMLESRMVSDYNRPIQRVLLVGTALGMVGTLPDRYASPEFRHALEDSFRTAAARCSVEMSTSGKPMSGRPDARLEIQGEVRYFHGTSGGWQYERFATYVATLTDLHLDREVWKGRFHVHYGEDLKPNPRYTETLARAVPDALFARLARDGVLRGCKPSESMPVR